MFVFCVGFVILERRSHPQTIEGTVGKKGRREDAFATRNTISSGGFVHTRCETQESREDVGGGRKIKKSIRTTAETIVTQREPEKPDFTL